MSRPRTRSRQLRRRGATLVLCAILIVFMMGLLAFAIDLGYIVLVRTQMQTAADAGALAGAAATFLGTETAEEEALRFIGYNEAGGHKIKPEDVQIRFGKWDSDSRVFTQAYSDAEAIEVTIRRENQPLFFGKIFGSTFDTEVSAVATFQPRDIMLVLDYSGSMSYDSQFGAIDDLGRSAVEANLLQIYNELGAPKFGKMKWTPESISSTNVNTVKSTLGLTNVKYPYPRGSWDDYINYVMNDSAVNKAGYRKKYGYLTWVHYLLAKNYSYSDNPNLWKTSQQPLTAVKNAVDVLVSYIQENSPKDRLGFTLYTAADGTAKVEQNLTDNFTKVAQLVRQRQAGHYTAYTNIYDGLRVGRLALQNGARPSAQKMIVLMTDGQANLPVNESYGKSYALQEAQQCKQNRIPVVTISLGADADSKLMQQIADITGGVHFNIPGGQSVADYEEQLKNVFRRVAGDRGLVLVK